MRRSLHLTITGFVIAVITAGCFGDETSPQERFAAEAEDICRKLDDQVRAIGSQAPTPGASVAQQEAAQDRRILAAIDSSSAAIRALGPPRSLRSDVDGWLAAFRGVWLAVMAMSAATHPYDGPAVARAKARFDRSADVVRKAVDRLPLGPECRGQEQER